MCGRFILISSQKELTEEYGLIETPEVHPRYNIAPSQEVAAIRYTPGTPNNRELIFLQWGLTPLSVQGPFQVIRAYKRPFGNHRFKTRFQIMFKEAKGPDTLEWFL